MQDIGLIRMNEGIDVRLRRYNAREVSITDSHEKGVDTSLKNNPTKKQYRMDDGNIVTIYSIFKRNSKLHGDGNPLLYALKKERGYSFASSYIEDLFWKRFNLILDKFVKEYGDANVVIISQDNPGIHKSAILIPSSKPINKKISDILKSKTNINIIEDVLLKKDTEEIYNTCCTEGSYFYNYWLRKNKLDDALDLLEDYLYSMNGTFKIHNIDNNELRNSIINTLKLNSDIIFNYNNQINGKHILIIDDTITRCQTFKSAYNAIISCYFPASITGLTMFSEKAK